jgi:hypothetical protein
LGSLRGLIIAAITFSALASVSATVHAGKAPHILLGATGPTPAVNVPCQNREAELRRMARAFLTIGPRQGMARTDVNRRLAAEVLDREDKRDTTGRNDLFRCMPLPRH